MSTQMRDNITQPRFQLAIPCKILRFVDQCENARFYLIMRFNCEPSYTINKVSHQRISKDFTQLTFVVGLLPLFLNTWVTQTGKKITGLKSTLEYDYSDSIFTHPLYLKEVVKLFRKEETDDFLTQITLFNPRATLSSF